MGLMKLIGFLAIVSPAAASGEVVLLQRALCPFQPKAAAAIFHRDAHDGSTVEEVKEALQQLVSFYGKCEAIQALGAEKYRIRFRDADMPLMASFGKNRKVARFELGSVEFRNDSWEKVTAFAARHMGRASLWLERGGKQLAALEPDLPLNVSRSAQIFLMRALSEKVKSRSMKWTDLVQLDRQAKSVSFGLLHSWVEGTQLTLDSLRNFVMIENDATAADLILKAVGRGAVEKGGKSLAPFLSHREFALLMGTSEGELDSVERKALPGAAAALEDAGMVPDFPEERLDLIGKVGWFASTRELCRALLEVREDPALRSSVRSLSEADRLGLGWENVVALQARDPGIAQGTVAFSDGSGLYCFSLTANRDELFDETAFSDLTSRVYALILKEKASRK